MKRNITFLLVLFTILYTSISAQNTYPWPSNQSIGIGTASPLAPLHVKNTVPLYGTITAQDAVNSGWQGQALNSFIGADGNRLAVFGPSWGNFLIQNDQSGVVALSPNGVTLMGGFSNNGNTLQVHGTGYIRDNLGIGTSYPNALLDAKGTIMASSWYTDAGVSITGDNGNYGSIQGIDSYNAEYRNLVLQEFDGNVAIGTNDSKGYKLAVNGSAIFTQAKVKLYGNWPDYVFHRAYKLPSLKEVESFVKQHKHLPGVPSAKEVEENGVDLGANQTELLKKVEELTLYIIDINKRIEKQEKNIAKQQKIIEGQAKLLAQKKH